MKNWITNHQGLLMSVAGAIVLGLLGGYADRLKESDNRAFDAGKWLKDHHPDIHDELLDAREKGEF